MGLFSVHESAQYRVGSCGTGWPGDLSNGHIGRRAAASSNIRRMAIKEHDNKQPYAEPVQATREIYTTTYNIDQDTLSRANEIKTGLATVFEQSKGL